MQTHINGHNLIIDGGKVVKKIINDVSFYNLRLKNGELIKNEGFKLSKIITDYIFNDLSNFPEFKKLIIKSKTNTLLIF